MTDKSQSSAEVLGIEEELGAFRELEADWDTEESPPIPTEVIEIEKQLDAFRELEADWDAEGSLPISEEVISCAKQLLRIIARIAKGARIHWSDPAVAPGGSGEIEISWEIRGRWSVLIVHPDRQNEVECVTKEAGSTPRRQALSVGDAVKEALWALKNA